ncbi:MAG: TolC family protein [Candidatus Caenarcaniphilales bacterium]|nr:TolC family protein [Candidatus Caenarcaniphilales bacterium]
MFKKVLIFLLFCLSISGAGQADDENLPLFNVISLDSNDEEISPIEQEVILEYESDDKDEYIEADTVDNPEDNFFDPTGNGASLLDTQQEISSPVKLDINPSKTVELNLEKALSTALKYNLSRRIVAETVKRDKWRFWDSTSSLLPNTSFDFNVVERSGGSSFSNSAGTAINRGENYLATFGIRESLSLPSIFGSIASYNDWMTNNKFLDLNSQELLRQTANQYYEVIRNRSELAVRIEAYQKAQENLVLNEALLEGGVGTRFSVIQAQTQLSDNELALLSQQSTARIAELRLFVLLNYPLEANLRLSESTVEKKTLISPDEPIESLVQFAFNHRPDIKRRYLAYKASQKRVAQAATEFAPSLSASFTTSSNTSTFGSSLEPSNISQFQTSAIGLNLTQRGFGLGQVSAINRQRAESRQANLEMEQEILEVESQVRDAFLRSQSTEQQIKSAEKQVNAAIEGLELARVRLKNGVGTNIDLIDSQRTFVNAWINKVRAIVQYNQSQVDLLRAIGNISIKRLNTNLEE